MATSWIRPDAHRSACIAIRLRDKADQRRLARCDIKLPLSTGHETYFGHHKFLEARRAPSARLSNLAHITVGCTRWITSDCANQQSLPAITFSRPTKPA